MLHEQKPSLEEAIEHYGVKGMKWGVRKSGKRGSSSGKLSKLNKKLDKRDAEIGKARASVKKSREELSVARSVHYRTRVTKGRSEVARQSKAELKKAKMNFLLNPNRVTAAKLKSGEILVDAVFLGTATSASIQNQRAISRQQERLQKKVKVQERRAKLGG